MKNAKYPSEAATELASKHAPNVRSLANLIDNMSTATDVGTDISKANLDHEPQSILRAIRNLTK